MHAKGLQRDVERIGGRFVNESSGRWHVYQCESPAGMVWSANSCHAIRVEWRRGASRDEIGDILSDAIDRVAEGVTQCDGHECDYCHPASNP